MSPYTTFTRGRNTDPRTVVATMEIDGHEILITKMGGLFVRPPKGLPDPHEGNFDQAQSEAKDAFADEAVRLFNLILCELSLRCGATCVPAAVLDIGYGRLTDGRADLRSMGSSPRTRALDPFLDVANGRGFDSWRHTHARQLDRVASLEWSRTLENVSPTLPLFTLAAYSSLMLQEWPQAMMLGWIVVEQLIDEAWSTYVAGREPRARRDRLGDTRTYTAAIRTEVLHTARVIKQPLYDQVNAARLKRNNLAHRAKTSRADAIEILTATTETLRWRLGRRVHSPYLAEGGGW